MPTSGYCGTCDTYFNKDTIDHHCSVVDLKKRIAKMEYELTTHRGLWAFDRDPKDVDLEWIRHNAFRLGYDSTGDVTK